MRLLLSELDPGPHWLVATAQPQPPYPSPRPVVTSADATGHHTPLIRCLKTLTIAGHLSIGSSHLINLSKVEAKILNEMGKI